MDLKIVALLITLAGFYILECGSNEIDIELPRFKNKYYFVEHIRTDWYGAWRSCHARHMVLVSIESQEENEFLNQYLRKGLELLPTQSKLFWTAGTKFTQENTYYWSASGRFVNYTNWDEGTPSNNKNYDFLLVRVSGSNDELRWRNMSSDKLFNPVCEITVNFP